MTTAAQPASQTAGRDADVIVIGGGHNGLTAAVALAQQGRRVVVVEQADELGGLARSVEFCPGYRSAGLLHETAAVRPHIAQQLGLAAHGLRWRRTPVRWVVDGETDGERSEPLAIDRAEGTVEGVSDGDRAAYRSYLAQAARLSRALRSVLDGAAPDLLGGGSRELLRGVRLALAVRRLGRKSMLSLLRAAPMNVGDWLTEQFASEPLRAALAGPALEGQRFGPRAPGTAALLLLRECTSRSEEVDGGPAALIRALSSAAEAANVTIELGREVERLVLENERIAGVRLVGGDTLRAPVVAASCDPQQTVLELLPPRHRPRRLAAALSRWRQQGTTAKVELALREPLRLPGVSKAVEALQVGGSLRALERAADAVKYRSFSERPVLDVRVVSAADGSLCPDGHAVASILVHFAAYQLEGGWSEERREALGDAAVAALSRAVPDLDEQIVGRRVLSPADIAEQLCLRGGHIHHGEHAIDQLLFLRPAAGLAGYATPVAGLFLCGSGCHPGGGVTCGPGWLGARAILSS